MTRCKEDLARMERARRDNTLWEPLGGGMARGICFEVGLDHSRFKDCEGGGHGVSGMKMRFILKGPAGAVHWVAYMNNWIPGNVDVIGTVRDTGAGVSVVSSAVATVPANSLLDGDGMPFDLGYHSPTPHWEGQEEYGRPDCDLVPEGETCYYDGSGLNAQPVLEAFLAHGPHAVWAALANYYQEALGERTDA